VGYSMEIVLLIGAAPYPLNESAARWLENAIRENCVDQLGRALDPSARACLELADVLSGDLERRSSQPIELGRSHVTGLCVHVLDERAARRSERLRRLLEGCLRAGDDAV
jgi:hypothetical protein